METVLHHGITHTCIVSGVVASLDNEKGVKGEIYNLGNSISLNEFIELYKKVVGKKGNYEQIELRDVPHTNADISKAK